MRILIKIHVCGSGSKSIFADPDQNPDRQHWYRFRPMTDTQTDTGQRQKQFKSNLLCMAAHGRTHGACGHLVSSLVYPFSKPVITYQHTHTHPTQHDGTLKGYFAGLFFIRFPELRDKHCPPFSPRKKTHFKIPSEQLTGCK